MPSTPRKPLFIYNAPVIDAIAPNPTHTPPHHHEYIQAVDKLIKLIVGYGPIPCTLLPYPCYLFSHDSCHTPDWIKEFQYDVAFELPPEQTIRHMGETYYPTAWILQQGHLVPIEFTIGVELSSEVRNIGPYKTLFTEVEIELSPFLGASNVLLRHFDATWRAGQYRLGAFAKYDSQIALDFSSQEPRHLSNLPLLGVRPDLLARQVRLRRALRSWL